MKTTNVSTPTIALPRTTASAPSASTQRTDGAPTVASTVQSPALFQTTFSTTSSQRSAAPMGEVLPTTVKPPTNERLTQGIINAYQKVFGGKKFPTGPERTALFNLSVEMRTAGASAGAIENAIINKLQTEAAALADKANPSQQLEDAIKLAYRGGAQPSPADRAKFLKAAQEMADKGTTATEIKWALYSQMTAAQEGTDTTGPAIQKKMFLEAYKQVHGHTATPSPTEEAKWMKEAAKIAESGVGATEIKWQLYSKMQAALNPVSSGPPSPGQAFQDAFRAVYDGSPSQADQTRWMARANELAKTEGISTSDIKWTLISEMNLAKAGLDNTRPDTLQRLVRESFKSATGGTASPADEQKWFAAATKMATDGASATEIKWALYAQIRAEKEGTGGDPKAPSVIRRVVEDAFKQATQNAGRPLSDRERTEWEKIGAKLAQDGLDANSIKWALVSQMYEALTNN